MDFQRLVIANPSGNITGIVFDRVSRDQMREVGALIQSNYPSIEQVLFVENKNGHIHGQMAGGEFCGNAARALGFVLAEGKNGLQKFTMSGLKEPVEVDIQGNKATLNTRINASKELVRFEDAPVPVVHLEGISHAIMLPDHPLSAFLKRTAARPDRWRSVCHVLEDLGLMDKPASGLVFVDKPDNHLTITPYVYVRDIKTLYPEMACASGSIAAALVNSETSLQTNASILQPSREKLDVSFEPTGNQYSIKVAGNMNILWDGPATGLHYSSGTLAGRHGASANRPQETQKLSHS